MKNEFEAAVDLLSGSDNFLIAGHAGPDGDCLGCMCALNLALRKLGKTSYAICPDGVPDVYRFLPASDSILSEIPVGQHVDTAIVVDCDGLDRTGPLAETIRSMPKLLEIDHHQGTGSGLGIALIFSSAAATGEIVFELLRRAHIEIDKDIADCLLTAIITDTGSFRYSNVTPDTLRISADLLDAGAIPSKIAQRVYESRSLQSVKLLGLALSTVRTEMDGTITYACVTQAHLAESGATDAESEGVVNYVRSIRGSRVAMLFREVAADSTRVSLRSVDGIDVSRIARQFGGGGHRAASGCTVDRPLVEAIPTVLEATKRWMES